jgi:formylglycine-generating enzyme required for sulfatase activity
MKKILSLCLGFALIALPAFIFANNIQVTNVGLTSQNIVSTNNSSNYTKVQFDLSWDNSWRISSGPSNYDAAWVFVKYQVFGGDWKHATLNTTASNHTITTTNSVGATITPSSDGKGVFIYRSGNGSGSIDWDQILLRWDYRSDNVDDTASVTIKVFAVEMVYVPQGKFFLGDGNVSTAPSTRGFRINNVGDTRPFEITSENSITAVSSTSSSTSGLYDPYNTNGYTVPSSYPKGFNAFYCMKYEITQGQYMEFFNTLPANLTMKQNRNLAGSSSTSEPGSRNGLKWDQQALNSMTMTTSVGSPDRACNYLAFYDLCAYSDWAALRPLSEFEYEKAARGSDATNSSSTIGVYPVNGEYAWGTTSINNISSSSNLTNDGQPSEGISSPTSSNANAHYNNPSGISGPVRVGIFAAKNWTSNQRRQSGASYYGIMELTGNLKEVCMTTYEPYNGTGSSFTATTHGNGALSSNGNSDVSSWSNASSEVTSSTYHSRVMTYRGGSFDNSSTSELITSIRDWYSSNCTSSYYAYCQFGRNYNYGGRCVRTAP